MTDHFDLQRFVDAQEPVYWRVVAELRQGQKQSHWMWFIFPQFAGLGRSPMARRFAIASREEATAYLRHGVPRRSTRAVRTSSFVEASSIQT